ncbi:tryptophan 2,3-dioxygenase family protein [Polyangium mundeleinium]|uniref:Tryptophan 2,3-dioxygenase n=1 Tax=Polyangium mundeleinium TaxID=2995306 RepID=A0ABT5F611_9BACT|nr:tryptophan 2,3-dioxygenase family protein [Polyangium mundeleinium]MDC0749540.1 tryptophan 2,3-dioxygenase family protein [Polyangium mundeleinium]
MRNYWDYIKVEELLSLQGGFDNDESKLSNDEVVFIVVHQVYELWFKLILRELETARDLFCQNPVPDMKLANAATSLRRVVALFEQAVPHFRVMETLTTRDYLDFRDRLIPASGFQSAQMREIEILLGLDDNLRIPLGREGSYMAALRSSDGSASPALARVEQRRESGPSFKAVLYEWLARTPIDGPATQESAERFARAFIAGHEKEIENRIRLAKQNALTPDDIARLEQRYRAEIKFAERFLQAEDEEGLDDEARAFRRRLRAAIVFLESYRELPRLAWPREVIDLVIAVEQQMIIWRQRHARMVERVIGRRTGTGGSAGVDYLDQTALRYRIFNDLWAVRTILLRKPSVPLLSHEDEYRFRVED